MTYITIQSKIARLWIQEESGKKTRNIQISIHQTKIFNDSITHLRTRNTHSHRRPIQQTFAKDEETEEKKKNNNNLWILMWTGRKVKEKKKRNSNGICCLFFTCSRSNFYFGRSLCVSIMQPILPSKLNLFVEFSGPNRLNQSIKSRYACFHTIDFR